MKNSKAKLAQILLTCGLLAGCQQANVPAPTSETESEAPLAAEEISTSGAKVAKAEGGKCAGDSCSGDKDDKKDKGSKCAGGSCSGHK
ncbi:MAG: hypothetical protein QNJ31_05660 [Candidatus Caenarcaniphilales bacterium]|nr:hypothetical protein [Candidatus Caenarcaniphilales bacterium]